MKSAGLVKTEQVPETLVIPDGETTIMLEDGTRMAYDRRTVITVGRGSSLTYIASLGAVSRARRAITMELHEGARADFIGFVVGRGSGAMTLTLNEDHIQGASWGRTTVFGLLSDAAELDLRALISIHPAANGSDGLFEGRAMLLSRDAHANVVPSLEIEARDVKATHRTAVGPIDPEQAFYCQTRGCTLEEAQSLITQGFFEQLLSRIGNASQRAVARTAWQTMLP